MREEVHSCWEGVVGAPGFSSGFACSDGRIKLLMDPDVNVKILLYQGFAEH